MIAVHGVEAAGFHYIEGQRPPPHSVDGLKHCGSCAHKILSFVPYNQGRLVERDLLGSFFVEELLASCRELLWAQIEQRALFQHVEGHIVALMAAFFFSFEPESFQTSFLIFQSIVTLCRG